jgi:signal transduction histidine kinase
VKSLMRENFHYKSERRVRYKNSEKVVGNIYNMVVKLFKTLRNLDSRYPLVGDGILTLVLAALAFFFLRAYWALQPLPVNTLLAAILVSLEIIPLSWRRVFPSAALLTVATAGVILQVLNIPETTFIVITSIITIFSTAAYGGRRRNLVCGICIAAIIGSISYKLVFSGNVVLPINRFLYGATNFLLNLMFFLPLWWFGNTLRKSREQTLKLRESTEQLLREREENARRAVVDERIRIARELHDVLAHHVSVMGIQAGAARQVLKQYPEKALNSLSLIETSSRQAVAELYRLLGLLRDEDQIEKFSPQPGLQQLEKLVADMQTAGLEVEIKLGGDKREIPEIVDLSAYRILEEALTNILKHASATKATIDMNYQKNELLLDITDNGHGVANDHKISSGGKGLIGMRERVNLVKGEFWAGNGPNGGFRVKAKLPLGE